MCGEQQPSLYERDPRRYVNECFDHAYEHVLDYPPATSELQRLLQAAHYLLSHGYDKDGSAVTIKKTRDLVAGRIRELIVEAHKRGHYLPGEELRLAQLRAEHDRLEVAMNQRHLTKNLAKLLGVNRSRIRHWFRRCRQNPALVRTYLTRLESANADRSEPRAAQA